MLRASRREGDIDFDPEGRAQLRIAEIGDTVVDVDRARAEHEPFLQPDRPRRAIGKNASIAAHQQLGQRTVELHELVQPMHEISRFMHAAPPRNPRSSSPTCKK